MRNSQTFIKKYTTNDKNISADYDIFIIFAVKLDNHIFYIMTLKTFLTLCATFLLSIQTGKAQTFIFGTKTNPRGETIEVDSKGIIINGRHTLPVMGEIHYARVPEREWRREIQKMESSSSAEAAR